MRNARLLAFLCFLHSICVADERQPELMVYTEEFPPYNYLENKTVMGVNIDLVRAICTRARIRCQFKLMPWKRAYALTLRQDNAGLVSTARSHKREPLFMWVGPLVSSSPHFYRLRRRADVDPKSLDEVTRFSVGVPRNDIYEEVLIQLGFEKGVNLMEFTYKNQDIKMFLEGRLDLIIGSEVTVPHKLKGMGVPVDKVQVVMPLPTAEYEGNYLALNPAYPRALKQRMDAALQALKAEGEYARIHRQYQ